MISRGFINKYINKLKNSTKTVQCDNYPIMIYVSTKQTKYFIVTRFQKMFGLLISGRLVDTNFREVDTTHAVIDVPDADNFNHVVVSPKYTQIVTNLLI